MYLTYGLAAAAILGWLLALIWAYLLRRWVHLCRQGRISIYYNRKAVLEAPIEDWVLWCRSLTRDDERVGGRVIYRGGKVSVLIVRPGTPR